MTANLEPVTTRLPADLYKRIKVFCTKTEQTVQTFVTKALEKAIKAA